MLKTWVKIGIVITASIMSCGALMLIDIVRGGQSFTVSNAMTILVSGLTLYLLVLLLNKFTV